VAYDFASASTQSLTVGSSTAAYNFIETTGVFTVAAWLKLTDHAANTACVLFDNNGTSSSSKGFALFWDNRSSVSRVKLLAASVTYGTVTQFKYNFLSSQNAITDNNWHHVIFSADNSNAFVYVDGSQVGNGASVGSLSSGSSTNDLRIGGSVLPMNGKIAEAAIWDVALSAGERTALAKGAKPNRVRPQSLALYAPLLRDLADYDSARTLTNNNSATVADHPRVY
jgi:hypothetical protein